MSRFRLKTLLRIREGIRDERRLELAQALRADAVLHGQIRELETQLTTLRRNAQASVAPGRVNVDRLLDTQRYELVLRGEQRMLEDRRQMLATEIGRRRAVLIEADRDVRVLEKMRENQQARERQESERREMAVIDELALRPFQVEETL